MKRDDLSFPFSIFLFPLLSVFFFFSFTGFSQNVFFGERNLADPKIALYFDQQGTVYPDFLIPDSSLRRCSGNLSDWYQLHPAEFSQICGSYNCSFSEVSKGNIVALQDSIIRRIGRKINAQNGKAVTFLVHGYRKSFAEIPNAVSSVKEFGLLRKQLDSLQLQNDLYVEVYWDATYDCCFSANKKKNDELFRLFETAQQNAPNVGLTLRRIIDEVAAPKINLIAHSLGCKVAVASLFNIVPSEIATPANQTVNLCLIAPAIGGMSTFTHFGQRNTATDFKSKDNYRVYIIYNESDFVLRKKDNKTGIFGPGAIRYGETTLGCNYQHETLKVEKYFSAYFPNTVIRTQDMSFLGKNHSLRTYSQQDHLKKMTDFLNK